MVGLPAVALPASPAAEPFPLPGGLALGGLATSHTLESEVDLAMPEIKVIQFMDAGAYPKTGRGKGD